MAECQACGGNAESHWGACVACRGLGVVAEDGARFDTEIPLFVLDDGSKRTLH